MGGREKWGKGIDREEKDEEEERKKGKVGRQRDWIRETNRWRKNRERREGIRERNE